MDDFIMDVQDTIMLDAEDSEDAAAAQEESCSNENNVDTEMVDAFLMASPPMSSTTFLLLPASSCSSSSSDCSDAEIISVSSTYNKLLESEKSEEAGDSESRESRSTELLLQVAAPATAAVAESYDLSCCCAAIPRAAAAPYKRFLAPKQLRTDPRAVSGGAATEPDLLHVRESPASCDHQQVEENNCTGKSSSVAARVWSSEELLLRSDSGGCGLCRLLERAEIQLKKLKDVCGIRSSMTRRCCKFSDSPQELQEEVQQQQVGRLRLMRSSSSVHDDHKLGLTILSELKDDSAKLKLLVSALDNSLNKLGILQQRLQEDDDDDDVVADRSEKTQREEALQGSLQGAAAAAAISTVVPPPPTQDHDQQPPKNTLTNGTSTITQDSISSSCNNVADEEEVPTSSSSPTAAAGNLEDSDELDNVCSHQRSSEDSCTKRVTCIVATAGGHHMESNKIQSLNYLQAVNA
ncbi:unnamed protein product [Sphagnum troendelagicum]|uniref:Uncharacterized protein n=1 Tax=Sphagnum troendelagicum TaxID=128251 RepID=A0ABP0U5Y1_9BRYO